MISKLKSYTWLDKYAHKYKGLWVALLDGQLITLDINPVRLSSRVEGYTDPAAVLLIEIDKWIEFTTHRQRRRVSYTPEQEVIETTPILPIPEDVPLETVVEEVVPEPKEVPEPVITPPEPPVSPPQGNIIDEFTIDIRYLTGVHLHAIVNYKELATYYGVPGAEESLYKINMTAKEITCNTTSKDFNIQEYLRRIGVPKEAIRYEN